MSKQVKTAEMFNHEIIEKIKHNIEHNDYEAFFYHNADLSKTIYVSPSYERVLNDTKENLYSNPLSFSELIIEDDKQRFMEQYNSYLTTGVFDLQFRVKNIEGNFLWIHAITEPVFDNGVVVGHITRARDITKQKEYEIELEEKEKLLSIIIQTQSEMICTYKLDTTLTFVNDAYCKLHSSTKEDLLGKKYIDLFAENDYQQEKEWNSSLTIDNPKRTKEFTRTLSNGNTIWIRWTDHAVFNTDGEQKEIISVGVDITSEKSLIENLENKNALLSTAQQNAKFGVYTVDLTKNLCYASSELNSLLEIEDNEEQNLSIWENLIHPDDKARVLKVHNNVINNKKPYRLKYRIITENSKITKWIYDVGNVEYLDDEPTKVIGLMLDISGLVTLEQKLDRTLNNLEKSYKDTIKGWAHALSLKDDETEQHSERVTKLAINLATHIGYPSEKIEQFEYGALLHDIGKMGIPDSILLKPGKLKLEEFAEIKKHPVYAYDMLSKIEYLKDALDIPYCHHEKWDGSGYPQGLKGEEIPLAARIFAIIDVFDALTSDRPYRKAWSFEKTIDYIKEQSGTHFDPMIVEAFLELMSLQKNES